MSSLPTYKEIQGKIKELFDADPSRYGGGRGPGVKDCHIAHAKEQLGLPKKPRGDSSPRVYPCPDDKLALIKDAFRALKMLE